MRAIAYDRFGPAKDVLNEIDLPVPTPLADEVVVKLVFPVLIRLTWRSCARYQ